MEEIMQETDKVSHQFLREIVLELLEENRTLRKLNKEMGVELIKFRLEVAKLQGKVNHPDAVDKLFSNYSQM